MADDKKPEKTETRGKPATVMDQLTGSQKDGVETDKAGDKVKETVPSDD